MSSLTSSRKEERLRKVVDPSMEISVRTYNAVIGGVVIYGIILNIIMYIIFEDMTANINPLIFIIGYFICCFAGTMISSRLDNPFISFLGYNLVVVPIGMVLNSILESYGGLDSIIVFQAFLITAIITFIMIMASIMFPDFFSKLGTVLISVLIGLLVAEIILSLLGVNQIITAWIGAGIFSLYIGYDFWKAQQFSKTLANAVDSALDIYLDIINLFIEILKILGSSKSKERR